jgi:hypothetical protein
LVSGVGEGLLCSSMMILIGARGIIAMRAGDWAGFMEKAE